MSPRKLKGQVKIRRRYPADSRQLGFQVGDGGEDLRNRSWRDFNGDESADHGGQSCESRSRSQFNAAWAAP